MTSLPPPSAKKLGLVIDLDTCVGCQACATSCKEWNTQGYSAPLTDEQIQDAMADNPSGQGDELTPLILIRPLS